MIFTKFLITFLKLTLILIIIYFSINTPASNHHFCENLFTNYTNSKKSTEVNSDILNLFYNKQLPPQPSRPFRTYGPFKGMVDPDEIKQLGISTEEAIANYGGIDIWFETIKPVSSLEEAKNHHTHIKNPLFWTLYSIVDNTKQFKFDELQQIKAAETANGITKEGKISQIFAPLLTKEFFFINEYGEKEIIPYEIAKKIFNPDKVEIVSTKHPVDISGFAIYQKAFFPRARGLISRKNMVLSKHVITHIKKLYKMLKIDGFEIKFGFFREALELACRQYRVGRTIHDNRHLKHKQEYEELHDAAKANAIVLLNKQGQILASLIIILNKKNGMIEADTTFYDERIGGNIDLAKLVLLAFTTRFGLTGYGLTEEEDIMTDVQVVSEWPAQSLKAKYYPIAQYLEWISKNKQESNEKQKELDLSSFKFEELWNHFYQILSNSEKDSDNTQHNSGKNKTVDKFIKVEPTVYNFGTNQKIHISYQHIETADIEILNINGNSDIVILFQQFSKNYLYKHDHEHENSKSIVPNSLTRQGDTIKFFIKTTPTHPKNILKKLIDQFATTMNEPHPN